MSTASNSTGMIRSAEAMLSLMEIDVKQAPGIKEGDERFDRLPKVWRANTVRNAQIAKTWRREGRQALAIHPAIVREVTLATSDRVPTEVFRALPYMNPMVIFPEPIRLESWRAMAQMRRDSLEKMYAAEPGDLTPYSEAGMQMVGYLVYAYHHPVLRLPAHPTRYERLLAEYEAIEGIVSTTSDGTAPMLGVTAIFEVLDENGNVVDTEASSLSWEFSMEQKTLREMVEEQVERFVFFDQDNGSLVPGVKKEWIREVFKIVLGTMMYLASTTLEAEKVPASATRHLRHTIARRPLSLYRVGWTMGAALDRYRREQISLGNESQMSDLAHQQDPQHRRAHFKTVWTGPGRTIPKTAFVTAYWTHRERLGEAGVNTLRRVREEA